MYLSHMLTAIRIWLKQLFISFLKSKFCNSEVLRESQVFRLVNMRYLSWKVLIEFGYLWDTLFFRDLKCLAFAPNVNSTKLADIMTLDCKYLGLETLRESRENSNRSAPCLIGIKRYFRWKLFSDKPISFFSWKLSRL